MSDKALTTIQAEEHVDYWLMAIRQMQEHGVITKAQKASLTTKVKAWIFDIIDKSEINQWPREE
jgi:molybdopterin-guanine dinucleotide biosynthesis protein A